METPSDFPGEDTKPPDMPIMTEAQVKEQVALARAAALAELPQGVTAGVMADLRLTYLEDPDPTTKDGMAKLKAGKKEVRDLRLAVEKKRKQLKADSLDWGRMVEAEAKKIQALISPVENEIDQVIKDEEEKLERQRQAEIARIDQHEAGIRFINDLIAKAATSATLEELDSVRQSAPAEILRADWEEYTDQALGLQGKLHTCIDERQALLEIRRDMAIRQAQEAAQAPQETTELALPPEGVQETRFDPEAALAQAGQRDELNGGPAARAHRDANLEEPTIFRHKISPETFGSIVRGKRFIVQDHRGRPEATPGAVLQFREHILPEGETGRIIEAEITWITRGLQKEGFEILQFKVEGDVLAEICAINPADVPF